MIRAAAIASLLAFTSGCGHEDPDPLATKQPKPRPAPDGVLYLAVDEVGLVRIAHGKAITIYPTRASLRALQVGRDEAAYLLAGDVVVRANEQGAKAIGPALDADAIAIARDGSVYLASDRTVQHLVNGVASSIPLVAPRRPCKHIGLDAHDVLYCGASEATDRRYPTPVQSLHRWVGGAWQPVELPEPSHGSVWNISGIEVGPDGRLIVQGANGFFSIAADGPGSGIAKPYATEVTTALFYQRTTPGGRAFVWGQPTSYIVSADRVAKPVTETMFAAAPEPTPMVDGLGRIWFATKTGGLGVSGSILDWPSCSEFGGIVGLAVIGRGPELPPSPPPIHGAVRGRIVRAKAPLANVKVIIASPNALLEDRDDAGCRITGTSDLAQIGLTGGVQQTTTDADGRFAFTDIPRQPATIMVLGTDDRPLFDSVMTKQLACCGQLTAAGLDLGTVTAP